MFTTNSGVREGVFNGLKAPEFPDGGETFSADSPAANSLDASYLPETSSMNMSSAMLDAVFMDLSGKAPGLLPVGAGGDPPSASLDASTSFPWGNVDVSTSSASAGMPPASVGLPSVEGDIPGDRPRGDDVELTGSHVHVKGGGGAFLGAGLAAGVTASVVAIAVGPGVSDKADKSEGEVRVHMCGLVFNLVGVQARIGIESVEYAVSAVVR